MTRNWICMKLDIYIMARTFFLLLLSFWFRLIRFLVSRWSVVLHLPLVSSLIRCSAQSESRSQYTIFLCSHRDAIPRLSISLSLDICIYLLLGFTASSEICLSMHKHIQQRLVCILLLHVFFLISILLRLIFYFPVCYGALKLISIYVAICCCAFVCSSFPCWWRGRSRFHGETTPKNIYVIYLPSLTATLFRAYFSSFSAFLLFCLLFECLSPFRLSCPPILTRMLLSNNRCKLK